MWKAIHRRSFRDVSIQQESIGENASQVRAAITVQSSVCKTQVAKHGFETRNSAETGPSQRSFGKLP
jgi:hypothetical protein